MAQHFLLSSAARSLSLKAIMAMTDEQAAETFQGIRWQETGGQPFCPRCRCAALYAYTTRALWKCKACCHQFSVTSGTIFASRKLAIRDILLAIALFTNAAKGMSALQLSRDLGCHYRTAFVLSHKLREAMRAECQLSGVVEVDGGYFGGHVKPENRKEDRKDRRLAENRTGKRQVVVVMRERGGRTLPFVFRAEDESLPAIQKAFIYLTHTTSIGSIIILSMRLLCRIYLLPTSTTKKLPSSFSKASSTPTACSARSAVS